MRIGMILDNEFTGDPRVENEVITLQNAGHQVFVLCLNYGGKPQRETFKGAEIIRIPINKNLKKKLNGLNNTLFNFYPIFWKRRIVKFIADFRIQHLHVHDLWMLEGALKANAKRPIKITADLHENFVFALKHYKYATTFPGNILISHRKWARSEKKWLKAVDHIIVVIEEAKERLIALGLPSEKISVVANYVNIDEYKTDDEALTSSIKKKYADYKTLVYTGGFDIHRGLDIIIKATKLIVNEIPNFKLILVGGGKIEEDLKRLVNELALEDHVDFVGYRPHKELPSYVNISDACIVPHLKTEHTDNTIPHKLFQYMLFEKPVVSSNCLPLERIVHESGAGYVYRNDHPAECAKAVVKVLSAENEHLGIAGKKAVKEKYNWTEAGKVLASIYE